MGSILTFHIILIASRYVWDWLSSHCSKINLASNAQSDFLQVNIIYNKTGINQLDSLKFSGFIYMGNILKFRNIYTGNILKVRTIYTDNILKVGTIYMGNMLKARTIYMGKIY